MRPEDEGEEPAGVRDAQSLPQFTLRAVLTGMVLGGVLSLCNVYAGLKIGWGFNMSVTAALISYGFWGLVSATTGARHWNLLENNVNQTAASSAASISSAGLVAPIPALTMITGLELSWPLLTLWTFSVSLVGVTVAVGLRRQMIHGEKLPFPSGIATAETLREMYARGREAVARIAMLTSGAVVAGTLKICVKIYQIPKLTLPGSITLAKDSVLAKEGLRQVSLKNLSFAVNPSLLMVGVGAIIGPRAGVSMLLGAVVSWGILGPIVLERGYAEPKLPALDGIWSGDLSAWAVPYEGSWFGPMVEWMLWPGVALMVTASLTSFAFSWRSVVDALRGRGGAGAEEEHTGAGGDVPRRVFKRALVGALLLSVVLQWLLFDITWYVGVFSVLLTFLLAVVAARVSGETGITPVGAMGKVTQLVFGGLVPGSATTNLMTANVTGGAASQSADLLHDMKTGTLVGASPRYLAFAQFFGIMAGATVGSYAYLLLIPNPSEQLLTEKWAAPAVAQWKAVAELFQKGFSEMPELAPEAMLYAGSAGILLAVLEKTLPRRAVSFVPSPGAFGLAWVIPAYYAIAMFLGGLAKAILERVVPQWTERFLIVLAAGLIVGDTLAGFGHAVFMALTGG